MGRALRPEFAATEIRRLLRAGPLGDRDVVFCVAKDVTGRFEAEEALRAEVEAARSASRSGVWRVIRT